MKSIIIRISYILPNCKNEKRNNNYQHHSLSEDVQITQRLFGQVWSTIKCGLNVLLFHKVVPAHLQRGLEVICPQRSRCLSLVVGLPNQAVDLHISSGRFPIGQNKNCDRQPCKQNPTSKDQQIEINSLPQCSERNHLLLQGWSDGGLLS